MVAASGPLNARLFDGVVCLLGCLRGVDQSVTVLLLQLHVISDQSGRIVVKTRRDAAAQLADFVVEPLEPSAAVERLEQLELTIPIMNGAQRLNFLNVGTAGTIGTSGTVFLMVFFYSWHLPPLSTSIFGRRIWDMATSTLPAPLSANPSGEPNISSLDC